MNSSIILFINYSYLTNNQGFYIDMISNNTII